MPELAPDLATCLDAARVDAARQGHDEVAIEHLLQCLFTSSVPALTYLARHALGAHPLRDALTLSLGTLQARAGYRGGGHLPALSPQLLALLDRAARRRWWSRRVESPWLLDAFFGSAEGAPLAENVRFDVRPVLSLRRSAEALAQALGHRNVLIDHGLAALLEQARFASAVRACSVDPLVARNRLFVRLGRRVRSFRLGSSAGLVQAASAVSNQHRRSALAMSDLVVSILRNPASHPALARMDLDVHDLLFAYVHQSPVENIEMMSPGATHVEVWFYDDAYTTMEHVVAVLTSDFDLDAERARATMLAVHERISALVGVYPRTWAIERTLRARDRGRQALMPLRVALRPA